MLKRVAGSVLWSLSEGTGIGLGRFAPAVLGWKLGSHPVRQPSEDVRASDTPDSPPEQRWRLHISRDARHLLTGEEPIAPIGTSAIPYDQRPTLLARFTRVAFVGDVRGRVTMMTSEAALELKGFLRTNAISVGTKAVVLEGRGGVQLQRYYFPEDVGWPDRPSRYVELWCGFDPEEKRWYVKDYAPYPAPAEEHSNALGELAAAVERFHRALLRSSKPRQPYYTDPLFWLFVLFFGSLLVRLVASLVAPLN